MASSIDRINASRANGARSAGPVTPEGKRRSALNSVTHGLDARTLILPGESGDSYDQLLAAYIETFQPVGRVELDLVMEMVAARWRQHRAWTVETATLNRQLEWDAGHRDEDDESPDRATCLAIAHRSLCDNSRSLDRAQRTEARMARMFERALALLLRIQSDRSNPPKTKNCTNEPKHHGPGPTPE